MHYLITSLRQNPELAIFLTLALGFLIGRIRLGSFSLGNVVGTLLAGVLIGQLDIKVDPIVKTVFFALFLFATGYKVGPQFFRGLKKSALPQVSLTVVLCLTSLITTVVAARILKYDCGTAAGLMAGAFTESTVIGTAGDTISRLDLPEEERRRLLNNIPVAYAVSYLVGTGFVVWFLSSLAPRLIKVDLKAESRKLEAQLGSGPTKEPGTQSAYREWDLRAYRLGLGPFADEGVAALEKSFAPARVFVDSIRRGVEIFEALPETVLRAGDVIAVAARREVILGSGTSLGTEVEDRELLEFPIAAVDVVLTNRRMSELKLADLAEEHGRGLVLLKLDRRHDPQSGGPAQPLRTPA
jgi:putative transport protein